MLLVPRFRLRGASLARVKLRFVYFAASWLPLIGCADILGLDGLTYDQGLEESSEGLGTEDKPPAVTFGSGGTIDLTEEEPDFPLELRLDAIVVSSPMPVHDSHYWVYAPGRDEIASYRLGSGADLQGTQDLPSDHGYTHLTVFPAGEGYRFFAYDSGSGSVAQFTDVDGEGEIVLEDQDVGTAGRSTLISFGFGESWLGLAESSDSGNYRYFEPDRDKGLDVVAGTWDPGYSRVSSFVYNDEQGVLRFNPEEGKIQFARLVAYGEPFETVFEIEAPFPATHLLTYAGPSGWELALYDAGTGWIETAVIGDFGEGPSYFMQEDSVFRENLVSLSIVYLEGYPHAITFGRSARIAQLRRLVPLDVTPGVIVK